MWKSCIARSKVTGKVPAKVAASYLPEGEALAGKLQKACALHRPSPEA